MTAYIVSSGITSNTPLYGGDTMSVFDNGESLGISVHKGGQEIVYDGGFAKKTSVDIGGTLSIFAGGVAHDTKLTKYATETVYSGGELSSSMIHYGSAVVFSGGTASNISVNDGSFYVSGGRAVDTALNGEQYVNSGGVVSSTTIDYGFQYLSGGKSFDTELDTASYQYVYSGSVARDTTASIGGAQQDIYAGGKSIDTIVSNNGQEDVSDNGQDVGGVAIGTTVNPGGFEVVASGGISRDTVVDGGVLVLAGGRATGGIKLSGTDSQIWIDTKKMPGTVISGFQAGDQILLTDVKYSTGASATVAEAGIVTISEGGKTYNLHIAGAVVGETDFIVITASSVPAGRTALEKSTSAAMPFLAPKQAMPATPFLIPMPARHVATETIATAAAASHGMIRETIEPGYHTPLIFSATHF